MDQYATIKEQSILSWNSKMGKQILLKLLVKSTFTKKYILNVIKITTCYADIEEDIVPDGDNTIVNYDDLAKVRFFYRSKKWPQFHFEFFFQLRGDIFFLFCAIS
jgi:hypothetical protein